MIEDTKTAIRERIYGSLREQKEDERRRKSLMIQKKLFALSQFAKSRTVLFYAAYDGEVETLEMIKQAIQLGKKIALPVILRAKKNILPALILDPTTDLEAGPYGILQPRSACQDVPVERIDLAVVPAVAFDKENYRLGRGQGYYDRFLSSLPKDTPTIGLAFDFQLVDRLPREGHDVPVSLVLTN